MPYYVIDPSGASYGPADVDLLHQWVREGRVLPSSTLRDAVSGQTMMATAIPGLFPGGGGQPGASPYGANPYAAQPPLMQPSGYYPRPVNAGSSDITTAWICAVVSLICCGPVGIAGIIISKRQLDAGNELARGPYIVSWVGVGLWILLFIGRLAMGGF